MRMEWKEIHPWCGQYEAALIFYRQQLVQRKMEKPLSLIPKLLLKTMEGSQRTYAVRTANVRYYVKERTGARCCSERNIQPELDARSRQIIHQKS